MNLIKTTIGTILLISVAGCGPYIYSKEIIRKDITTKPVNFTSDSARETFTCTIKSIERHVINSKKFQESQQVKFLEFVIYEKEFFVSDNAFFNDMVDRADLDHNATINKPEAIAFYKSYFPGHKYVEVHETDGFLKKLNASAARPYCDIHEES